MAHWIGRVLSTNNEREAIGILRMLDCGSRKGFDQLTFELQGFSTIKEVKPETVLAARNMMDTILLQDRAEAQEYLKGKGLSTEATERVLALTHCEPPEDYFITSGDMVGKAAVWGHFGAWDFKKAYVYNSLIKETPDTAVPKIEEIFGVDKKQAGKIYYEALALPDEDQANA